MFNLDISILKELFMFLRLIALLALLFNFIISHRISLHMSRGNTKESLISQNELNSYRIWGTGAATLFSALAVLAGLLYLFSTPSFDFVCLFNVVVYTAIAILSASAFHATHETQKNLEELIAFKEKINKL